MKNLHLPLLLLFFMCFFVHKSALAADYSEVSRKRTPLDDKFCKEYEDRTDEEKKNLRKIFDRDCTQSNSPTAGTLLETHTASNRVSILGVYLGADTLRDIKVRADDNRISDFGPAHSLSAESKFVTPNTVSGYDGELTSGKFTINGNSLRGTFLNGRLIEIEVIDTRGMAGIDEKDGPKLILQFNSKYKPEKIELKRSNGAGVAIAETYYTWKEKGDSFTIELTDTRYRVINTQECLAFAESLTGVVMVRNQMRCHPSMNNTPNYSLSYRYDKIFMPVLTELLRLERDQKAQQSKNEKLKLNRF